MEEFFGIVTLTGKGNADTGRQIHRDSFQIVGLCNRVIEAPSETLNLTFVAQVLAQDDELVTRKTRHGVARAERVREPCTDGNQEIITGLMP